ncbi:hypothetical protein SDRG_08950 [Saprolegnia diclina VS20]|uniref:C3H1-type domain-containing protein n=1 Tax=Saprolegnia diclina (strain VS20) TaxID=1156394 RepID=T0QI88_SAPDV|nr:hypothetical protein SDRG_08950 [Saprolegnia diclina VS20]EQC33435.1 hypothetical protein SDRG_08950 [Saprolegnia diclina VS20]|eukprot:XP_008613075.1 hypothetical protein SDRG_08950 [Saprolegnia diclina VS20]
MSAPPPPMTPEDVGTLLNPQQRNAVQDRVNALLGWNSKEIAPMAIAIPMLRSTRKQIMELGYLVGSQWTGIRYLALLVAGRCYLISHNYEIREAWLFAPLRQQDRPAAAENETNQHMWTVLDGTLVMHQDKLTYVITDILAMNGTAVMTHKLEERLKTIQNSVIGPLTKIPIPKGHPPSQFGLIFPPNRPLVKMTSSIRHLTPTPTNTAVQHAGLVFLPQALPYTPGYGKGLFSWTYPVLVTAYFQLGVEWRGMPKKPVFKLNVWDKGMSVFYDWITFPGDCYDHFCNDKKASQRIIECMYDSENWTFIPSEDKSSDTGHAGFQSVERGVGWRKGGWKLLRVRKDVGRPYDRAHLTQLEKCLSDNIRGEEIEAFFTANAANPLASPEDDKWKKTLAPSQGVCYDFQNKGICQRGTKCHFSHCACHNVCSCTAASHTYGQRPDFRRNDFDAPPEANADGSVKLEEAPIALESLPAVVKVEPEGSVDVPLAVPAATVSAAAAPVVAAVAPVPVPEKKPVVTQPLVRGKVNASSVYAPLANFDKETLAAKRAMLSATGNRRIWSSLGLEDSTGKKATKKKQKVGWIVSSAGDVSYVRDK